MCKASTLPLAGKLVYLLPVGIFNYILDYAYFILHIQLYCIRGNVMYLLCIILLRCIHNRILIKLT